MIGTLVSIPAFLFLHHQFDTYSFNPPDIYLELDSPIREILLFAFCFAVSVFGAAILSLANSQVCDLCGSRFWGKTITAQTRHGDYVFCSLQCQMHYLKEMDVDISEIRIKDG